MYIVMCPKDLARVERSIRSIAAKIEVSLEKSLSSRYAKFLREEKELEKYCFENNLIYSPTKFSDYVSK